jgi:hypothetical protein
MLAAKKAFIDRMTNPFTPDEEIKDVFMDPLP